MGGELSRGEGTRTAKGDKEGEVRRIGGEERLGKEEK